MALNGKIAVVTGAAMGIGRAITEMFLQNGAKVALLDVKENVGKTLKESLDKENGPDKTLFMNCNVESEEQVQAALQKTVETFGGVDILCNNAGIFDESNWEKTVAVNLVGVIRVTYLALQHMNKLTGGRGGVVVNMSSIAGLSPFLSGPVYSATKHGVIGFTRAMAAASDVSGYGIRFNTVCPGVVKTDLFNSFHENLGQFSHLLDIGLKLAASTTEMSVSQVAECFLELVTDETKNGEALFVNCNKKQYMTFPALLT